MFVTMAEVKDSKPIKTIRELMGLEPEVFAVPTMGEDVPPRVALPVAEPLVIQEVPEAAPAVPEEAADEVIELDVREFGSPLSRFLSRDWVRYPLIFLVALGFFYVILNFRAISTQLANFVSAPGREEKLKLEQISPQYAKWQKKYYVFAGSPETFQPKNDADWDGLLNVEEFYLGTNPLKTDTDNDGYNDGREVLNGYNPLYEGRLTAVQAEMVAAQVNREGVESRNKLQDQQGVAGEQLPMDTFRLDPGKPGNISIPKLGVDAAIIWSREFAKMEEDLKYGVAHHPETVYPGEQGLASIHGHSSGNLWDGNFQTVFTKLNFLEPGDEVFVTVYAGNGTSRRYRYVVRSEKVYAKTDKAQFAAPADGYFLNLSTSWPIGTARERYVVTTELVGL